jgi:hypothetical protein
VDFFFFLLRRCLDGAELELEAQTEGQAEFLAALLDGLDFSIKRANIPSCTFQLPKCGALPF